MSNDVWSPDQYERFREERRQPFADLMDLVRPRPDMHVVDLGCGTGELTHALHRAFHARETLGIDLSEAMLTRSAAFQEPGLRFERGDISEFVPSRPVDLLFSNAALHWVDDHVALFTRLTRSIAPGGQLAVQMPANHDHPSHVVAAELALEEPFREALGGHRRVSPLLPAVGYAALLDQLGFGHQHVRMQVYPHHLERRDDVIEWVKGTLLTDYSSRMPAELFELFLSRYRERLLPRLPDTTPFFFPFQRILLWASRDAAA